MNQKKFIDDQRKTMEGKEPQRLKTPAKKTWVWLLSYLKIKTLSFSFIFIRIDNTWQINNPKVVFFSRKKPHQYLFFTHNYFLSFSLQHHFLLLLYVSLSSIAIVA